MHNAVPPHTNAGSWREGITWDTRSSYCWLSTPPPSVTGQQLQYWQGNCRMPLGQIYWVLLIQVCIRYLSICLCMASYCWPMFWSPPVCMLGTQRSVGFGLRLPVWASSTADQKLSTHSLGMQTILTLRPPFPRPT